MTVITEGALLDVPDRLVVSPGFGRFVHGQPSVVTAEGELAYRDDVLGELQTTGGVVQVRCPSDAWVLRFLVRDGEWVRPGYPLVHLRTL